MRERRQPRKDLRGKDERAGGRKVGGKGDRKEGRMGEKEEEREQCHWFGGEGEG